MTHLISTSAKSLAFVLLGVLLAACQSAETRTTQSNYAIEITEEPGAFILTFHNKSGRSLCIPFSSWPGVSGHRGYVEQVPRIIRNGVTNPYSRQVRIDPQAPAVYRFRKRSKTSAQLRFQDFSFDVKDGDGNFLRFDPDVSFCPRFKVPPLNKP